MEFLVIQRFGSTFCMSPQVPLLTPEERAIVSSPVPALNYLSPCARGQSRGGGPWREAGSGRVWEPSESLAVAVPSIAHGHVQRAFKSVLVPVLQKGRGQVGGTGGCVRSVGFFLPDEGGQSLPGLFSGDKFPCCPQSLWFQKKLDRLAEPHFLQGSPTPDLLPSNRAWPGLHGQTTPTGVPPAKASPGKERAQRGFLGLRSQALTLCFKSASRTLSVMDIFDRIILCYGGGAVL